jgi:hypothetical protein
MYVPHLALNPISDQEWELIDRDQIDKTAVARQNEINAIINEHVIQGERVEFSEPFLIFGARISYDFDFQGQSTLQVYTGVQNILYQTQQNHDRGVFRGRRLHIWSNSSSNAQCWRKNRKPTKTRGFPAMKGFA